MSRSAAKARTVRRASPFPWTYAALAAGVLLTLAALALSGSGSLAWQAPASGKRTLQSPVSGERAYGYLQEICAIGPRVAGTEGMRRQQAWLTAHFEQLGGRVRLQEFTGRHPETGQAVPLGNLIVEWHPDRQERILLAAHYDTRPFPDQDPVNPRGVFIGANDGASGVALLSELAHHLPQLASKYGVDFVLFDAEELVYDGQRDPYFLGSEHFARDYVTNRPPHTYRCGVLVDMIGDAQLQIYRELNSLKTPQTRQLVQDIWGVAKSLGVTDFIHRNGHEVRDDHLALNNIAGIPTIDIIDFDYPTPRTGTGYWHTTHDTPDKCSAQSLATVGAVLHAWLERLK